jgi:hypothetical protein
VSPTSRFVLGALLSAACLAPATASAFCGFYVGGADAKLFNNATQVVLLREGARTVMSMQNNYQGPPSDFAMVVPVPVVLQKENVKTLPRDVFDRIDQLTAPRLVEYWEQDPCPSRDRGRYADRSESAAMPRPMAMAPAPGGGRQTVKIEAEFTVGEYEVVILSAEDSMGLDTWLRQNNYKIPDGAEAALRPYVAAGSKFFVAKVISSKVRFEKGMATLSPLRFHFDDDRFSLPVRLGLLNSGGTQDLIVNVIAKDQRYEVANYPGAFIPTNLDLAEGARGEFGAFYAALFDRTVESNPGAVVTEYAWSAGSCDPCPGPALNAQDLNTLGADVLPSQQTPTDGMAHASGGRSVPVWQYAITRLHARYTKAALGEDLIFKKAPPVEGGREHDGAGGKLRQDAKVLASGVNNFQGRYAIRHPWRGDITCTDPRYGVWGGAQASAARDVAFAPRGGTTLASMLAVDVPALGLRGTPIEVSRHISPLAYVAFLRSARASLALGLLLGVGTAAALARRNRRSA